MLNKEQQKRQNMISLAAVLAFLVLVFVLDQVIKPTDSVSMLLTVLQKGSVYALPPCRRKSAPRRCWARSQQHPGHKRQHSPAAQQKGSLARRLRLF